MNKWKLIKEKENSKIHVLTKLKSWKKELILT